MKISEVMTTDITSLQPEASLQEAAKQMRDAQCGFIPVCSEEGTLLGVITDRDIVTRALAEGIDPAKAPVESIMSDDVTCCFADDALESATNKMRIQGIYRVPVLSNPETRKFCGIVSLGDVLRHDEIELAASTAKMISRAA